MCKCYCVGGISRCWLKRASMPTERRHGGASSRVHPMRLGQGALNAFSFGLRSIAWDQTDNSRCLVWANVKYTSAVSRLCPPCRGDLVSIGALALHQQHRLENRYIRRQRQDQQHDVIGLWASIWSLRLYAAWRIANSWWNKQIILSSDYLVNCSDGITAITSVSFTGIYTECHRNGGWFAILPPLATRRLIIEELIDGETVYDLSPTRRA